MSFCLSCTKGTNHKAHVGLLGGERANDPLGRNMEEQKPVGFK